MPVTVFGVRCALAASRTRWRDHGLTQNVVKKPSLLLIAASSRASSTSTAASSRSSRPASSASPTRAQRSPPMGTALTGTPTRTSPASSSSGSSWSPTPARRSPATRSASSSAISARPVRWARPTSSTPRKVAFACPTWWNEVPAEAIRSDSIRTGGRSGPGAPPATMAPVGRAGWPSSRARASVWASRSAGSTARGEVAVRASLATVRRSSASPSLTVTPWAPVSAPPAMSRATTCTSRVGSTASCSVARSSRVPPAAQGRLATGAVATTTATVPGSAPGSPRAVPDRIGSASMRSRFTSVTGCSPRNVTERSRTGNHLHRFASRYGRDPGRTT